MGGAVEEEQAVALPPEWWQRARTRFAGWRSSHEATFGWFTRARAVVVWAALPVLLVLYIFNESLRALTGLYLTALWVLFLWWLLSRSKTLSWAFVARLFSVCVFWAGCIAVISILVSRHLAGMSASSDSSGTVIAGMVEETLKVAPLVVLAIVAPGRVRRFAITDYALVGLVGGLGFTVVEEGARPVVSWFGSTTWCSNSWVAGCGEGAWTNFGQFNGSGAYPGHQIEAALIALAIGFAVAILRGPARSSWARSWLWPTAVVLPAAIWWVTVSDHAAFNADAFGGRWEKFPLVMRVAHEVSTWLPHHHTILVWGILLAVVIDLHSLVQGGFGDPIPGRTSTLARLRSQAERLTGDFPAVVRAPAMALIDTAYAVARDLLDFVLAVSIPGRKEAIVNGRAIVVMQRQAREAGYGALHDTTSSGRHRARLAGAAGLALLAVVVLVVAPLLTRHMASVLNDTMVYDPNWLAGLFDRLGRWWSGQSGWTKAAILIGIAALTIASGGTFGLAFAIAGGAATLLDNAGTIADLIEDPKGNATNYFTTHTPVDIAIDAALLGLNFAGKGTVGAVGGVGVKVGGSAARTAVQDGIRAYRAMPLAVREHGAISLGRATVEEPGLIARRVTATIEAQTRLITRADGILAKNGITNLNDTWTKIPPLQRGIVIEAHLGGNLPGSFRTIDRFTPSGVADSIKSMDLRAPTYLNKPSAVESRLRSSIDSVSRYVGGDCGGVTMSPGDIEERTLRVASLPS